MNITVQLVTAFLGSFGFCLIYNIKKEKLLPISLCGAMCWGCYLLSSYLGADIFMASFLASVFAGIVGELFSHLFKAPTTVFFIPTCIPLIPGGNLYRTMLALVRKDNSRAALYGRNTALCALGIAAGLGAVSAIVYIFNSQKRKTMHT